MADSSIGALPQAPQLDDDSLLVAEQQGQAMKVTGAQFKEFGRQAVIGQVQSYVDAAQAAAAQAVDAVTAVTEMTVEAHASDTATVTKTTKSGKVNLDFGLPRGEQGEPGPEGQTGPRGPQGPPGNGLTILGHYDTEQALRVAVTAPEVGDAYGVGEELPYDTYVFDGATLDWKNYGPLSGGSSVIPEDVVTSVGGAVLEIPALFGDAPHTITFTDEEEPPLTAGDIVYGDETVKEAIDGLFTSVSDGKALIASAVTDKGISTAPDASFSQMAENIGQIQTGGDTSDATATPGDILSPKTAYTASGKVEGIIPSLPAQTITPGTADKTIANGQYLSGTQTIKGDPNLTSSNIKKGVSLFGVAGALESSFTATLTVKADIGAVVTATCGDTSVEALSTTGSVVLELPIEGTWKVTAQRGMAQYNTATVVVSSQYSAELTAEVHLVKFGNATAMSEAKMMMKLGEVGGYVLFAGGTRYSKLSSYSYEEHAASRTPTEVYDQNLTHTTASSVNHCVSAYSNGYNYGFVYGASASIESFAIFAGGQYGPSYAGPVSNGVAAFDETLTKESATLSVARANLAGAAIGEYALFSGGSDGTAASDVVDAFDGSITHSTPPGLILPLSAPAAVSCGSNAIFAGGNNQVATAYSSNLTRKALAPLENSETIIAASPAGNYGLFVSSTGAVEAYDLFLTKTDAQPLSEARSGLGVTSNSLFAVFAGGYREGSVGSGGNEVATIDIYDAYLTRTSITGERRKWQTGATIEEFAIFAGGGSYSVSVEAGWTYGSVTSDAVVYQYT